MGDDLATSRNAIEDQMGTRLDNVFPEDGGSAIASARNEDATARIRNGPASVPAAAKTANTISRLSYPPSGR